MGLFDELPAPAVPKPTVLTANPDAELEAQLELLKQQGAVQLIAANSAADDAEEKELREEDEEEEEEESPHELEPASAHGSDLRRRPRPRDDDDEEQEEGDGHAGRHETARPLHARHQEEQPAAASTWPSALRRRHQEAEPSPPEHPGTAQQGQASADAPAEQPQRKRVRISEVEVTHVHAPPSPKPLQEDEVTMALRRIANHIANPSKFPKACPLLRKLLDGDALKRSQHQADLFQAVRSAFLDPVTCTEALLRREYMKLIAAIANRADLFGKAEKAHLDIYRLVGHVQNELSTDDSFVFNKALGRIKEALEELEEATPEDDIILRNLESRGQGNAWAAPGSAHDGEEERYAEQVQRAKVEHVRLMKRWEEEQRRAKAREEQEERERRAQKEEGEEDPEADPFGLETLMAAQTKVKPPTVRSSPPELVLPAPLHPTTAWSAEETGCMRREAVLQCLSTCQTYHKHAWARTGVELLIEQCYENKARFCSAQHAVLEDLMNWVKLQRVQRKQGPSAKELNRDSTSFERARAEWSKATVSHRGKVGGNGDAKANNWLG